MDEAVVASNGFSEGNVEITGDLIHLEVAVGETTLTLLGKHRGILLLPLTLRKMGDEG